MSTQTHIYTHVASEIRRENICYRDYLEQSPNLLNGKTRARDRCGTIEESERTSSECKEAEEEPEHEMQKNQPLPLGKGPLTRTVEDGVQTVEPAGVGGQVEESAILTQVRLVPWKMPLPISEPNLGPRTMKSLCNEWGLVDGDVLCCMAFERSPQK